MAPRTLLLTKTGEPYQPVRLRWTVPSRAYCLKRLRGLQCVGEDGPAKTLTLWHMAEAAELTFGDPQRKRSPVPLAPGETIILGRFRFPNDMCMELEVRSFHRAIDLARLLRPRLGKKVDLTGARVINRWFEASENAVGLAELDKCLDRDVTVIRPEETERAIEAAVAPGRTPAERRALYAAWVEARGHIDVPLVEDFPCHPEDENDQMGDLSNTLTFRFLRAGRIWQGEKVTLQQIIQEAVTSMHAAKRK